MRDILVVAIVLAGAAMALRRPWIGVLLWTWLSLMNPHRYAWGFSYEAPLAAIAAGVTLVGILTTKERRSPFLGAPAWFFAALTCWITASFLLGVDVAGDYAVWSKVMKIYLMTLVALVLLHSKYQILAFAWVTTLSLAILGAKGGVFTILHGGDYRVWGPPSSFIEDNNEFALALAMTIPLLHFLQLRLTRRGTRHLITAIMLLCAAAALGSHSRGGLLAIIAMVGMFWWRSTRKLPAGVLIVLAVGVLLPMMPESWWTRMETITSYGDDASAQGRLYGWQVALSVATHNVFGGGMSYQHPMYFSEYGLGGNTVIAAHSIYFQVLGNHGFVGLILFCAFWVSTYRCAGWLRVNTRGVPQAAWAGDLGSMVQVGLVAYGVGGAFLSLAYFDLPYNMMIMVVVARKWVEERAWEREPQVSFLEYVGLRSTKSPSPGAVKRNHAAGRR